MWIHISCGLRPRKGPLERVPFPTLSQTQSPFQQLGHHLLLLGKKIDAATLEGVGHCMCKKYCFVMYSMDIMWQEKLEPHTSDKKALELEHGPYLLVINMMIECYMCPKAGYWHWPALGRTEAMECQVDCCASSSHGEVT